MPRMFICILMLIFKAPSVFAADIKAVSWQSNSELSNQWYVSQLSDSFHLLLNEQNVSAKPEPEHIVSGVNGGYNLPISKNVNWFMEAGLVTPSQHVGDAFPAENQYHMSTGLNYVFADRLVLESKITQMHLSLSPQTLGPHNTSLGFATSYKIIQNLNVKAAIDMQLEHQIMHLGLDYRF
ncbi:hypothetical protein [Motilimonas sp. KMU-193]|uniref:hypothetical protein n=1 Tax=Motilimonas sp. KMU-193 TaxID=3388668 RepID=UPI00396B2CC6